MTAPAPEDVETVLRHLHPEKPLLDALAASLKGLAATKGKEVPSDKLLGDFPQGKQIQETRQRLLAMTTEEVARLAAAAKAQQAAKRQAEAASREAARFYNQPSASANFKFWATVENWTPDDAVALLLGRDPRMVNAETLAAELRTGTRVPGLGKVEGRAAFHQAFDDLSTLVRRSDAWSAGRLKPQAALAWARNLAAVTVPPELAAVVDMQPQAALAPPAEPTSKAIGTAKQWTPERLAELGAVRAERGTKAAAEQFNISEARVRKLLPSAADAKSAEPELQTWPPRAKQPAPRR